jgi:dihydroflavonol-4-reductase
VKVPHFVALTAAVFDETINGRLLGKEPRATIETVQMGRKKMWVSSAKAEKELRYTHGPAKEALRRAAEWFVAHGYAPGYALAEATA